MTSPAPAPTAGRTAPAPKGPNWWLIGGILLVVIAIAAIALWARGAFPAPQAPAPGETQTITATVPATAPKGSDLPRGTKIEGGKIVPVNGGMITAFIGANGVEKDGLKLAVERKGGTLVATIKPAKGGKLSVDVTAAATSGAFPSTYWNVERPQSPADVLVVEIPLGKGEQTATLYLGK